MIIGEMTMLPPKVRSVGTSVRLPEDLLKRLDTIATETNRSRNEVIAELLRWAVKEYDAEKKGGR